jgi:hypothetical protein
MFFYAVNSFSDADYIRLNIEICVIYGANFVDRQTADGNCGLTYLMEMCTQQLNLWEIKKNYSLQNTRKPSKE